MDRGSATPAGRPSTLSADADGAGARSDAGEDRAQLLLGCEAVALAGLHAGIGAVYSYPGTPATEIFEFIERAARARIRSSTPLAEPAVHAVWSGNEKVALEEALGASYAGRRALVAFKHVGLNVAADPFVNAALTGVDGGLVLAVADDPGMHSSQNEQDTRYYAELANVPCLEPASVQEAYDMTLEAFALSERVRLPVVLRLVTRLAHCRAPVRTVAPEAHMVPGPARPSPRGMDWVLLPAVSRRAQERVVATQETLRTWSAESHWNELVLPSSTTHAQVGRKIGVLTAGVASTYFLEAFAGEAPPPYLRIGTLPAPAALVARLCETVDEILVIEEGYPYLERALRGLADLGPGQGARRISGRLDGALPRTGELTPDAVRAAFGRGAHRATPIPSLSLPERPPSLCEGCPHGDSVNVINALRRERPSLRVFGDIGCYTLVATPPFEALDATVCMGASIGMAMGAAQAGMHPVLAVIGDSTFIHSGIVALLGAVQQDLDLTVLLLDNAGVGMTGGQPTPATGGRLMDLLRGLGVPPEHLHDIRPQAEDHAANVAVLRRAIDHRGLSVVVARRECVLLTR